MKEPVRIFSDLHLGHKLSRITDVSALRPLIAGAGTVVFNGDTWQELAEPFRARAQVMLEQLRELCAEEGAETVFLPGNHDPGWPGSGWLELADGAVVVTHGDALLRASSPWKREIISAQKQVEEIWAAHPGADHDARQRLEIARVIARELGSVEYPLGRLLVQRVWDAVLPLSRLLWILRAWFTQGSAGARFCETYFPKARFLVIGHFHHRGCWRRGQRIIINTGSFLDPGRAGWVEWANGQMAHGLIEESSSACRLSPNIATWKVSLPPS
jgi:predicted phosphodiesterase